MQSIYLKIYLETKVDFLFSSEKYFTGNEFFGGTANGNWCRHTNMLREVLELRIYNISDQDI